MCTVHGALPFLHAAQWTAREARPLGRQANTSLAFAAPGAASGARLCRRHDGGDPDWSMWQGAGACRENKQQSMTISDTLS